MKMKRSTRKQLSFESLENRLALSTYEPFTMGALGDSYTSLPYGKTGDRNWVEILSLFRRVSFGYPTGGHNSKPINSRFLNDRAVPASDSTYIVENQLPKLLPDVASGRVQYVAIFIGVVDFGSFVGNTMQDTNLPQTEVNQRANRVYTIATRNLNTTIDDLIKTNPAVKIVVITPPDLLRVPLIIKALSGPNGQFAGNALAVIEQTYDNYVRSLAEVSPSIAVADFAATSLVKLGSPYSPTTTPYSTGDRDSFLPDLIHPNTIAQGWIANDVLAAIRTKFHAFAPGIPDSQIARLAQLAKSR